jgi:hypothetical protein
MFGLFNERRLLEQKIMIWQNFHGSLDFIEIIEEAENDGRSIYPQYQKDLNKRLLEKLKSIHAMSSTIINNGNHKKLLSKDHLNYIWQDNRALRGIFEEHIRGGEMFMTFDERINPPYGWDIALKDWN